MSAMLRLAVLEDAETIVGIYAPYVTDSSVTFETEVPSAEEYRHRMEQIMRFFPFLVLEDAGEIVGYAYAHFFAERKAYQWLCETSIYVKQGLHRRGYASQLYAALLDALKAQGFCDAIAVLGCPNDASERLHEHMGFTLTMTYPNAGYKLGQWHDVKYYCRPLRPRTEYPEAPKPFCCAMDEWKKMEKTEKPSE